MKKIVLLGIVLLCGESVYAADDTSIRLNQEISQQQYQNDKKLLKSDDPKKDQALPNLIIQGQEYMVKDEPAEVAYALYLAVMQKQWQVALRYLEKYKNFPNYDQALTEFAEGVMARTQGNLSLAESKLKHSLEIQSNNLMTQLELARVYTEQQKNQQGQQLFQQIQSQLNLLTDPAAQGIRQTVEMYINGLKQRDAWHGSLAFGSRYASNINNASDKHDIITYYAIDPNTKEVVPVEQVKRGTPDAISAQGLDYEATLTKRWSLSGQHGIALRGLFYGQVYPDQTDYNELTFNLNAGYSFYNERNQVLVAPVFEHKYYAHDSLYSAYGLRSEWMRFISNDKAVKLEAEMKDMNYSQYKGQNGMEYSVYSTFWKILPKNWTLFGGLDFVDHNTQEQYFTAYQQQGIRLGLAKNFTAGFNTHLFSSFRWRQFDKFTPVLEARRHDFEQNYTLIISAPRWAFYGLTPNLTYQYNQNNSNVEWLYSYDKHNISLKLEHRF